LERSCRLDHAVGAELHRLILEVDGAIGSTLHSSGCGSAKVTCRRCERGDELAVGLDESAVGVERGHDLSIGRFDATVGVEDDRLRRSWPRTSFR